MCDYFRDVDNFVSFGNPKPHITVFGRPHPLIEEADLFDTAPAKRRRRTQNMRSSRIDMPCNVPGKILFRWRFGNTSNRTFGIDSCDSAMGDTRRWIRVQGSYSNLEPPFQPDIVRI